ncbi:MAG: AEC family transporter [Pelagibacteraceae bacterium]
MELLLRLFEAVFPVFFIVGIGYYLGKKNPKIDTTFITNFSANIGSPGLIFYSITSTGITFDLFSVYFFYALVAITGFAIIGLIFLFFQKKDLITELPPFILPNTGNMGLPICLFAYGAKGFGVASAVSSVVMLLHFTLGVFLAKKKFESQLIFKTPAFYAIIFSLIFLYFKIKPPVFMVNLTMLLSYATIFLVLMSLGIALTRLKIFSFKDAIIASIGRVMIGPIIGFVLIKFMNLTGYAAGVLLIQCSMPSAVLTYLVGSMYSSKKVVDSIASMIVVSTLISFATIPIVVFFALKHFN